MFPTFHLVKTHLLELLNEILSNCPSFHSLHSHYLADGIWLKFMDKYDGQIYELVIKKHKEI